MHLLPFLKEARWTKNLPPKTRANAAFVLAVKDYEKVLQAVSKGELRLTDPSVVAREVRLARLANAAEIGHQLPKLSPRMEKVLGTDSALLKEFQRPGSVKTHFQRGRFPDSPHGPLPPPGFKSPPPTPSWGKSFADAVTQRAKHLGAWAKRNKKPLGVTAAVAGAAGLGMLALRAATRKRHTRLYEGNP